MQSTPLAVIDTEQESDTTPQLRSVFGQAELPNSTLKRLAVYGDMTLGAFRKMLEGIIFVSCGKEHEFDGMGASNCRIQKMNGRCAHQRPFRQLKDVNAATVVEDALLFAAALGLLTEQELATAKPIIYDTRKALEMLDLVGAKSCSVLSRTPEGQPTNHPMAGHTFTRQDVQQFIRTQEDNSTVLFEELTRRAQRIFTQLTSAV